MLTIVSDMKQVLAFAHGNSTCNLPTKPKTSQKKAAIMLVGIMHSCSAALHNKSEQKQSSILIQRTLNQITGPSLQLHEALCQWEVRKVNDEGPSHCAGLPPATQSEKLVARKIRRREKTTCSL